MEELAEALLGLDWSDMDDFAQHLDSTIVHNDSVSRDDIEPRFIAQVLLDWANDNRKT